LKNYGTNRKRRKTTRDTHEQEPKWEIPVCLTVLNSQTSIAKPYASHMHRFFVIVIGFLISLNFLRAAEPDTSAGDGVRIANSVFHEIIHPAQLVTGNGDISLMWNGSGGDSTLWFGKSDFWGIVRGNITTAGNLRLTCPELNGGSMVMQERLGPATITGQFQSHDSAKLETRSWIGYPENLMVTELSNIGEVPLHFKSSLNNGLGTPNCDADKGTEGDVSWIRVSPDLLPIEVGNRQSVSFHAPFVGEMRSVQIKSPSLLSPFLPWKPQDQNVQNIGDLEVKDVEGHADTVNFTGESDHRLVFPGACLPEAAFTVTATLRPRQSSPDATILSAIAVESPNQYPYFRGFLLHLVDGKPEVLWNYYSVRASSAIPLNEWTDLKAVYEDQVLKLYVNGKLVGTGENPPASEQMGWDKATLRTGDPALPFHGLPPQALLAQRVVAASHAPDNAPQAQGQSIQFVLGPGETAQLRVALVSDRNTKNYEQTALDLVNSDDAHLTAFAQKRNAFWNQFWGKSYVNIPNRRVLENWYGSIYLLACCSRADCPPPGLWHNFIKEMNTPWQGDYTLDYNYQAPFWAAYATGHFELSDNYEPLLLNHMSRGRSIAANAWRMSSAGQPDSLSKYVAERELTKDHPANPDALNYQGIMLYTHLIPMPGWSNDYGTFWQQKSNALFCTVNMVMRWRLTHDLAYAHEVYAFLKETAEFWDHDLMLQNGRYVAVHDALCETSGDNTNPATTLSFLRLLYPALIEISHRLNVDAELRTTWQDIRDHLSPFTFVPASAIGGLHNVPPNLLEGKNVIRDCESQGPDFPTPAYVDYHDHKVRASSAGMSIVQTVFPGWTFGMENPTSEREAALNTITFAAQWYDFNNDCNFYPAAAAIGYDPKEIIANLQALIETSEQPDFTINTGGGGTENDAITPCTLWHCFLQSYQSKLHIFPNWPHDWDASFAGLPACGGFLVSAKQTAGAVEYVKITSKFGGTCAMANPWPGKSVNLHDKNQISGSTKAIFGDILSIQIPPNGAVTITSR